MVTTMLAVRGRLRVHKASCALCSWLALMSMSSRSACDGNVVMQPTDVCNSAASPAIIGVATIH